jgi:hypothetical protein
MVFRKVCAPSGSRSWAAHASREGRNLAVSDISRTHAIQGAVDPLRGFTSGQAVQPGDAAQVGAR